MARPLLYVLPHAGGAAYGYASLAEALTPDLEVCCLELPGHGRRAGEKPLVDIGEMTEDLLRGMDPDPVQPWAIFGHSMGAFLAHALCRKIACRPEGRPAHLFVSGTSAPGHGRHLAISHLPGNEFWKKLSGYGGLPAEVLASSELREYFEEILRHDFRAVETYEPASDQLDVPMTVFFGQDDMSREEAESWQAVTSADCRICMFPGAHFFLFNAIGEISGVIKQTLKDDNLSRCEKGG